MDRIIERYRKLVFFTWFLTLDLIMFGAFVRLTDSGLGCPDWPGCYGKASPLGALADIHQAATDMPFGPVTLSKAWIEMIHRYVGALLGLLIIAITYMAWRYRRQLGRSPVLATVALVAVCVQGAFGAWTVTHRLMPVVVTAHLVLGLSLLALMTWLAARERPHLAVPAYAARLLPWLAGGLGLLAAQVTLGGWVSTNYAALACMDFPTCHGEWVPEMDFHGGFSLIRALGELPSGEMISQSALTAIHWLHRNFAFVVFLYLGVLAWRMRRVPGVSGPAWLMLALLLAQLLTGLTTIFFQWPLLIAVLHNGGAAGLVLACVVALVRLSTAGGPPLRKL
ncbi:cytochrome C oxidase subunit I [Bordetella trematum]|uniref:Cytochrome oxidase assembly protein n=1 Tax=Bordetella trematum TaxID=123899 RepID=A0A157MIA6_9BORD|nr:COX15/CtaA family protein [Bordetella trematum]AUL48796.1 heme A synthase [Bordetella trematum]AZR95740.1 cytochrome C oxidase subunit I [Bordetella trematum]NNH18834.1 heme A synthase [Bordetella trematum]QIM70719.1 heme A synthase [Bordetella trematum]CZZ90774.1 cytochrome oxidase assembly protein [Bordetella trematum]